MTETGSDLEQTKLDQGLGLIKAVATVIATLLLM